MMDDGLPERSLGHARWEGLPPILQVAASFDDELRAIVHHYKTTPAMPRHEIMEAAACALARRIVPEDLR